MNIAVIQENSIQTPHWYPTFKRRVKGRSQVVSAWNTRGVFLGLLSKSPALIGLSRKHGLFLYVLELFGLVLICLFPIEKTKNISVSLQMRFGFLYFVSFFWCIYIKVQTFTHQINQKFLCIFTTVSKKLKSSHTHICTAYSQYPITRLIKANIFWKKGLYSWQTDLYLQIYSRKEIYTY